MLTATGRDATATCTVGTTGTAVVTVTFGLNKERHADKEQRPASLTAVTVAVPVFFAVAVAVTFFLVAVAVTFFLVAVAVTFFDHRRSIRGTLGAYQGQLGVSPSSSLSR